MSNVLIEIDALEAVEYVKSRIDGISDSRARMAVRTAINNAAKEIKKLDEKTAKQVYTDKSELKALKFQRATTANLTAILRDSGSAVSMEKFSIYRGKRVGVTAVINRNRGRKNIGKFGNKAFFNGGKVRVRKTNKRFPLETMHSLSSPSAHGSPDVWGKIEGTARQKLYENLEKEISRLLGS